MAETQNPKNTQTEQDPFRQVYGDITFFVDSMVSEYALVPEVLRMMQQGKATVELKKRYLLKAINEDWVNVVEDSLIALDTCIRNPTRYIEEIEEIVPIELSRTLSPRSIQHLATHTNLISKIEGDNITPSKILNVHREETLMTYENKFVNTLINRLYIFVNHRYEIAKRQGEDEQTTSLDFSESFTHGKVNGKMHFRMEITEDPSDTGDKASRNYFTSSNLFRRVEKLNGVVSTYLHSSFCQEMGNNFIRPPVMRTNAILKNKDLHQLLDLWMFIESYEGAGYSMLIQEDLKEVDKAYVKELYSTLALQYLIFRYNINSTFGSDPTLASRITEDELRPQIVDSLDELTEQEFAVSYPSKKIPIPSKTRYGLLSPDDRMMLEAIDIALDADAQATGTELGHIPLQSEQTGPSPAEEQLAAEAKAREEAIRAEKEAEEQAKREAEEAAALAAHAEAERLYRETQAMFQDDTYPEDYFLRSEENKDAEEGAGAPDGQTGTDTEPDGGQTDDATAESDEAGKEEREEDREDGRDRGRHPAPGRRDRVRFDGSPERRAALHSRVHRTVGANRQYGKHHPGKVVYPRRKGLRQRRRGR